MTQHAIGVEPTTGLRMQAPAAPAGTGWRRATVRVSALSLVLLAPCFWHRHIEAGDLGSHVYNAWLAELIRHGQAPGLSVAPLWNNVLFDWMLSLAGHWFGFTSADKVAVPVCVLLFFWGAFCIATALTGRRPWFLTPVLATLSYGWTFHMGFFNFYLSLALSFWALAALLVLPRRWKILALPLGALTYAAHPTGALWFALSASFLWFISHATSRARWLVFAIVVVAATVVRTYLKLHYETEYVPFLRFCVLNGSDQLVLAPDYRWVAVCLNFYTIAVLGAEFARCRRDPSEYWSRLRVPVQLYLALVLGAWAIPDFIVMPDMGRFGFVSERFSLLLAIAACCAISAVAYRRAYALAGLGIAAAFFALTFRDTAVLDRMETRIGSLLSVVGRNDRVLSRIGFPPSGSRLAFNHMVDRQCVGRCWSFANYEPATGHFRVRAQPGNRIVATTKDEVDGMWGGDYIIKPADLPAWQIYQTSADPMSLAIRPLAAGQKNGQPSPSPTAEAVSTPRERGGVQ